MGPCHFRVHLAGEEFRLTSDHQLSRFITLPAILPLLQRVSAERFARWDRNLLTYQHSTPSPVFRLVDLPHH